MSQCRDTKKEESDKDLKRAQFEISSEEDHEDQRKIRRFRALMEILMIEGATPHKVERMEEKSSNCQVWSDLEVTSHNNPVFHISSIRKGVVFRHWVFKVGI